MDLRQLSIILIAFLLLPHTSGLPSFQDFMNQWITKDEDGSKSDFKSSERVKRQDPGIGDESQLSYEVISSSLPSIPGTDPVQVNTRYMPVIANGHIGTTVYSSELFMNRFYTGEGAESHRAMIPAIVMTRITFNDDNIERSTTRRYKFNVQEGVFTEIIDSPNAYIEHRTYVHAKYTRLLVTDIYARRKDSNYDALLYLSYANVNDTADVIWEQEQDYYGNIQVRGMAKTPESGNAKDTVTVFFHKRLNSISLRGSNREVNETMVMAVDHLESAAKSDFDAARIILGDLNNNGNYELLRQHMNVWENMWARGRVEIEGDTLISKITRFSQYYLLSSLPQIHYAHQTPQYDEIFFGQARNSLGKGGSNKDYRGHMFWDTEMYILPAILPFHPDMAKSILRYRSALTQPALAHSKSMGAEGYRFPWESGRYGEDVTPDSCIHCREQQLFVSGAVSWAIRQYYTATRDRDYMINAEYNGCDMTREIARFYASIAEYDTSKARYNIKNVMGPDDWHPNVNNNAFTNVLASLSIHWARYFACLCNRNERSEVPDEWVQKALYLELPFDNVRRLHFQHDGFETTQNRTVKQADTIMLTYPLNWNMSVDIMRNDLDYYEQYTDPQTPAMTWSFFTVGWKWVKEEAKKLNYFQKSYQDYLIQPFKIWTEFNERNMADQQRGSVNFLPGMGGFIQSLVYGFGGVRFRPEFLEFHSPEPPPNCERMRFVGFNYLGANLTIDIGHSSTILEVIDIGDTGLLLRYNSSSSKADETLTPGAIIEIKDPKDGFYLYPLDGTSCEHPRDYIFMPWGYSPWISTASTFHFSLLSATFLALSSVAVLELLFFGHLL